jgi:hypothetical protein
MRPARLRPLMPKHIFIRKMMWNLFYAFLLVVFSLSAGTLGYHAFASLSWVDSFYNSSMILTGMGPVSHLETNGAKLFASIYAIYCGVAFLSSMAVLFGPMIHRVLHKYHLDIEEA